MRPQEPRPHRPPPARRGIRRVQPRSILIKYGQFPQEFADNCGNNYRWLLEQRDAINSHSVEVAGKKIRPMFSWIKRTINILQK